jgi:phage protein D
MGALAVEVKVAGAPLDPAMAAQITDIKVIDHLLLPDSMWLKISDPQHQYLEAELLGIGKEVEVSAAAPSGGAMALIFQGQVAALEPEFTSKGSVLAVRAYDHSHVLHRTKRSETFQNVTPDDVARKVAQRAGLQVGKVDPGGAPQPFVQQHNETDWAFLWRLASAIDFEVLVKDKKLNFQKADHGSETALTLRWGETLLAFRPRVTGVQQVEEVVIRGWDPATKRTIEGRAKPGTADAEVAVKRTDAVKAMGGGTLAVADRPVVSQAEADKLATSLAAKVGAGFMEADGTGTGNPLLGAGKRIKIEGLGTRFAGTMTLSSTTHVVRGGKGYETQFTISGRSTRSLLELMTPSNDAKWTEQIVVGLVTQNEDPDKLGRVRVKYPALGDDTEGWWARVAGINAGASRGVLMLPQPGDEVLLAFEHGDVRRPYVLGSVFNGTAKPEDLSRTDGSFGLMSDKEIHMEAKKAIEIKGGETFKLETSQSSDIDASTSAGVKAGTEIKISAGTRLVLDAGAQIEISAPAISVSATGVIKLTGTQVLVV